VIARLALVSAAAAALVLTPAAAMAYDAPGYGSSISDPGPRVGRALAFSINGNPKIGGKSVLLTVTSKPASLPNDAIEIAGTATTSKVANANGDVTFEVTMTQPGAYDLVATVDGAAVSTQALTVASASAAAGAASGKGLAATGFDGAGLAAGAGALVVAGAGAVMVAKRRQSAQLGA